MPRLFISYFYFISKTFRIFRVYCGYIRVYQNSVKHLQACLPSLCFHPLLICRKEEIIPSVSYYVVLLVLSSINFTPLFPIVLCICIIKSIKWVAETMLTFLFLPLIFILLSFMAKCHFDVDFNVEHFRQMPQKYFQLKFTYPHRQSSRLLALSLISTIVEAEANICSCVECHGIKKKWKIFDPFVRYSNHKYKSL